jgi:hypothetical protein
MCSLGGAESVRSQPDRGAWSVVGSSLSRDGLRTEDELFAALQKAWWEHDVSVTDSLCGELQVPSRDGCEGSGECDFSAAIVGHFASRPRM